MAERPPKRALSLNAPCLCGSGKKGKGCCGPTLDRGAATAEALMRSRFTAYCLGNARHLQATTAPESPHWQSDAAAWRLDIEDWCSRAHLTALTVIDAHEDGDSGEVTFWATLDFDGVDGSFGEKSRFIRRDGRWLYVDGPPIERPARLPSAT